MTDPKAFLSLQIILVCQANKDIVIFMVKIRKNSNHYNFFSNGYHNLHTSLFFCSVLLKNALIQSIDDGLFGGELSGVDKRWEGN